MISEKNLLFCFSGTGASCQMIIFFLIKRQLQYEN